MGGLKIGRSEAEVEAGLPDAQAASVLATTAVESEEEEVKMERKRRNDLRRREMQMDGIDSLSAEKQRVSRQP